LYNKKIEEALEKLKDKWKKLNSISNNKISKIDLISKTIQDLAEKNARMKNKDMSNDDYEHLIKKLKDEKNSLSVENDKLLKELREYKNADTDDIIKKLKESNDALIKELLGEKETNKILQAENDDLKNAPSTSKKEDFVDDKPQYLNEALQKKLDEETIKNNNLNNEAQKLKSIIDELKTKENFPLITNESFSEKSYQLKKEDIRKLKNEIQRQKDEISNLIKDNNELQDEVNNLKKKYNKKQFSSITDEVSFTINKQKVAPSQNLGNNFDEIMNMMKLITKYENQLNVIKDNFSKNLRMNREYQFTLAPSLQLKPEKFDDNTTHYSKKIILEEDNQCKNCEMWTDKAFDLKTSLKSNIFKELKQFYINYSVDISKISEKIEEVVFNYSNIEKQFNPENTGNKQKLKEYMSQIYKLISVLSVFIDKYNQDLYYYTQNLKKVFDFVGKTVYNQSFVGNSVNSISSKKSANKSEKFSSTLNEKKKANYLESKCVIS